MSEKQIYASREEMLNDISKKVGIPKDQVKQVIKMSWHHNLDFIEQKLKEKAVNTAISVRDIEH